MAIPLFLGAQIAEKVPGSTYPFVLTVLAELVFLAFHILQGIKMATWDVFLFLATLVAAFVRLFGTLLNVHLAFRLGRPE